MSDLDLRVRDLLDRLVPEWLSARIQQKKTTGYRFLFGMVAGLDAGLDVLNQGLAAWYPGRGTPSALPLIGRSRGILRNQDESDADYAERLIAWLDFWPDAGSQFLIGLTIHAFLRSHPRVRVINRAGRWFTVETDGTTSVTQATWDWDSVSNPERNDPDAPYWSDMWIVVQPSQWTLRAGELGDLTGDDGLGLGLDIAREEVDALKMLIHALQGAHSRVRAMLITTDPDKYDPAVPASCPDGTWGMWGMYSSGHYVVGGRDLTTTRYMEPW